MNTVSQLYDRSVRVELSQAAARACAERSSPLPVELELRFGCRVIKRARLSDAPPLALDVPGTRIDPCLYLDFRATIANACDPGGKGNSVTRDQTPIANLSPYVPSWCRIDYVGGLWSCEFGYDRARRSTPAAMAH